MLQSLQVGVDVRAARGGLHGEGRRQLRVGQAFEKRPPFRFDILPAGPHLREGAEVPALCHGGWWGAKPAGEPQLLGPDDVTQRAVNAAMAALEIPPVWLRGKAGQGVEDAAVCPGVELVQLPHEGHGHAGASAPPSSTLRSIVFPSITASSPTSESRTALRTTRTFFPRIEFAISLSVT